MEAPTGGSMPVPDPTRLTTDAVNSLRRELTEYFGERLDAQAALNAERFRNVNDQIQQERELRKEQKADRKVELDAALSAAKDLNAQQAANFAADTAKTEERFNKALIAQGQTTDTAIGSLTTQLQDQKERLTRIEANKVGGVEAVTERRQGSAAVYAAVGIIVTVILAVMGVVTAISVK
jgi:hypothetical protein